MSKILNIIDEIKENMDELFQKETKIATDARYKLGEIYYVDTENVFLRFIEKKLDKLNVYADNILNKNNKDVENVSVLNNINYELREIQEIVLDLKDGRRDRVIFSDYYELNFYTINKELEKERKFPSISNREKYLNGRKVLLLCDQIENKIDLCYEMLCDKQDKIIDNLSDIEQIVSYPNNLEIQKIEEKFLNTINTYHALNKERSHDAALHFLDRKTSKMKKELNSSSATFSNFTSLILLSS